MILGLSPRRLLAASFIIAAALLAVLLIILWQVGVFDSAPPPAALESAVGSVRQEEPQQEASSVDAQQAAEEPSSPGSQPQQETPAQSAAADPGSSYGQSEAADADAESQQAAPADGDQYGDAYGYDDQTQQQTGQAEQATDSEQRQAQQTSVVEPGTLADLAGTWTISQRGSSFVGYRIGEELANIGTATAVGRTGDIEATLEFDGMAITAVVITADLRTLQSDQSFRDSALRTRGIETDTYPFATFTLTEPIPIDALPSGEAPLSVTVAGTLELHGVTNAVSISLAGQYVDGLVVVAGSTEIALADYEIEKPTGFRVLSIEDVGIMEFELVFERAQ